MSQTRRPEAPELEKRTTPLPVALRATGARRMIGGYAAVFDRTSDDLGGFRERIDSRAFNKSAGDQWAGAMCRYQHLDEMLLGTTAGRTLRLAIDSTGLFYEVDLPEHRGDVLELVSRGDVSASSFAFQAFDDDWGVGDGLPMRTLVSVRLIDVAPVTSPAYPDATVGLRSLARHVGAPIEDVVKRAACNELRGFFVRTDVDYRNASAAIATRAQPTPADRLLQLINMRYDGGRPETSKDGTQAMVEIMGRRSGPGEL